MQDRCHNLDYHIEDFFLVQNLRMTPKHLAVSITQFPENLNVFIFFLPKLSLPTFTFRLQKKNLSWPLSSQNHKFFHVHFNSFLLPSIARIADKLSWSGLSNTSGSYFITFDLQSDFWTLATDTGSARNKTKRVLRVCQKKISLSKKKTVLFKKGFWKIFQSIFFQLPFLKNEIARTNRLGNNGDSTSRYFL
jgi:hypothetical protein